MNRPFYILLLAVYPILYIAAANPGQADSGSVFTAGAVAFVAALVATALAQPVFKSWERAALAVAVLLVFFFSFGPVFSTLDIVLLKRANRGGSLGAFAGGVLAQLHWALSLIWLVLLVPAFRALRRVEAAALPQLTRGLNFMSLILVALVSVQGLVGMKGDSGDSIAGDFSRGKKVSVLGYNPDVYYIILDGYARGDILKDYYGYDNREFLGGLKKRGFSVNTESWANYAWTYLSLASSLNFNYIQDFLGDQAKGRSRSAPYRAIRDNGASHFLRERGYRFVHFQTTWGATLQNAYADEQVPCHRGTFGDDFYRTVAEASWLKALDSRATQDLAQCHLSNLKSLGEMGVKPGPKFVFAHFVPPHHPYLFDKDGKVLSNATISDQFDFQAHLWEEKDKYLDQVLFMNRRITEAVDQILATSPKPPIIIIQSDHGPNLSKGLSKDEHWRVRLANMAAYLLPGAPAGLMPSDGAPVNQFRRVFNHYFDAGFEVLPERHYVSVYRKPYQFTEVQPRHLGPKVAGRN